MKKKLKLYVWEDFATDYKPGLAFAIADSLLNAQKLIIEQIGYNPSDWGYYSEHPISEPIAFAHVGGA